MLAVIIDRASRSTGVPPVPRDSNRKGSDMSSRPPGNIPACLFRSVGLLVLTTGLLSAPTASAATDPKSGVSASDQVQFQQKTVEAQMQELQERSVYHVTHETDCANVA